MLSPAAKRRRRRQNITIGLIFALMIIASAWIAMRPQGEPTAQAPVSQAQPAQPDAPWTGSATKDVNMTLFVGSRQVLIKTITFRGLDTPRATVRAEVVVTQPGKKRSWMNKAFWLQRGTRIVWRPAISERRVDRKTYLMLTWRKIPSISMNGKMAMVTDVPGIAQAFALALNPDLPANAVLGRKGAPAPPEAGGSGPAKPMPRAS